MNLLKQTLVATAVALLFASSSVSAQFKMPSFGKPAASSSTNTDAPVAQDSLVRAFVASHTEVLAAQELLAEAYDLKDQAALLAAEQKSLASGATDQSDLKKSVEVSSNANEEITAKQNQGAVLTAEQKKYYEQSLPHLAKGVIGTRVVIGEAQKFTSNAKGSLGGGLMGMGSAMTKLKAGAYVAKAMPSYSRNLFDAFRKTMTIGQSNGVRTPNDATQALSDL